MPRKKNVLLQAQKLLTRYPEGEAFLPNRRDLNRIPTLLRELVTELERLQQIEQIYNDEIKAGRVLYEGEENPNVSSHT